MGLPVPLERDVQKGVVDFYRSLGCVVYNLAQGYRPGGRRHGTTRQTKGLADLYVCWPARALTWWHEVKRTGGTQSAEQVVFQQTNEACGVAVVVGGTREAVAYIARIRGGRPG